MWGGGVVGPYLERNLFSEFHEGGAGDYVMGILQNRYGTYSTVLSGRYGHGVIMVSK